MSLFSFITKRTDRFLSDKDHRKNVKLQLSMTPQTLKQLHSYGVNDNSKLKLEFFFFTDQSEKAEKLKSALDDKSYSIRELHLTENQHWIISGWTTQLQMDLDTILSWTKEMCDIGFEHDCEFDGWGTTPEQ
jgi:regulator of RNase E activity RraB